jgi:ATP-binding cassette subfamily C protein CydD
LRRKRSERHFLNQLKPYRLPVAAALLADLPVAALIVVQAFLLASVVDGVFLKGKDLAALRSELIGLFLAACVRLSISWLQQNSLSRTGARLKSDLRGRLTKHLHGLSGTDQAEAFMPLYEEQTDAIVQYLTGYIPQLTRAVGIPLVVLIFIFPLDILSAVVFLITAPLIPVFMMLIGSMTQTVARRKWRRLAQMNAFFLDVLQGLTTIRLFDRVTYFLGRIKQTSEQFRSGSMQVLRVAFLAALVMEMLTTLSTAIIAVEVGLRLLYDHMVFREALFILIIAPEFYQPMRQLGSRFHTAVAGLTAADKYTGFIASGAPAVQIKKQVKPDLKTATISFSDVSFGYPGKNDMVLEDITLQLPPRGLTVIAGPSGAGKSTLLSLMMRFIGPVKGNIRAGDTDIESFPADLWRSRISWVSQEPYLFNRTVHENIAMARPGATPEDIKKAAAAAHFDRVVERMPQGYDSLIGERGMLLSAGEKRRLALARVFLRDGPLVLIDEPTASIDALTNDLIIGAVKKMAAERTVLLVSHDTEIYDQASRVLLLSHGKIQADGDHKELMKKNDAYKKYIG